MASAFLTLAPAFNLLDGLGHVFLGQAGQGYRVLRQQRRPHEKNSLRKRRRKREPAKSVDL
jgi:hypothetical protein